mmetsp:Transcript_26614/g.53503  ORF Transcript_26614/g.53503 Transcript_26614/m.53503 type:complete len:86 (-) Transcript_26614:1341-1598(-)
MIKSLRQISEPPSGFADGHLYGFLYYMIFVLNLRRKFLVCGEALYDRPEFGNCGGVRSSAIKQVRGLPRKKMRVTIGFILAKDAS